jgi:hypothetical protein
MGCPQPRAAAGTQMDRQRPENGHSSSERTLHFLNPDGGCSMDEVVFREESAIEYFKSLVDAALAHQQIRAGELTSFYVVQLLTTFLRQPAADDDEALALKLTRALETAGPEQRNSLKQVGDISLFISGFFSDSLVRKPVDVDYYTAIGGCAYSALSRFETDALSPAFAELSQKFGEFVDVLGEVSERTLCASNTDLLRLYEKWLKTGSRRSGKLLEQRGVVPNASIPRHRIH